MTEPSQKPKMTVKDFERAQAVRQVAHALSLYVSGKFAAPRIIFLGPLLRTIIVRADNDNEGLTDAVQAADLFAQAAEIRAMGVSYIFGTNQLAMHEIPARTGALLSRTAETLENLWQVIGRLTDTLMDDGVICGNEFSQAMEGSGRHKSRRKRASTV